MVKETRTGSGTVGKGERKMSEPNILMTRIDNRLVHGQVGVTWTKTLGANLIVVADDGVAEDPLQQQLMQVTAESSGVGIRFFFNSENNRSDSQSVLKTKNIYRL